MHKNDLCINNKFQRLSCLLTSQSHSGRSCSFWHPAISSNDKSKTIRYRIPKDYVNIRNVLCRWSEHSLLWSSHTTQNRGSSQWWGWHNCDLSTAGYKKRTPNRRVRARMSVCVCVQESECLRVTSAAVSKNRLTVRGMWAELACTRPSQTNTRCGYRLQSNFTHSTCF